MSTETKIGLIIGLGFIVCFAVLLANTEPEQISGAQWSHVVDAADTSTHSGKQTLSNLEKRAQTGSQRTAQRRNNPEGGVADTKSLPIHAGRPMSQPVAASTKSAAQGRSTGAQDLRGLTPSKKTTPKRNTLPRSQHATGSAERSSRNGARLGGSASPPMNKQQKQDRLRRYLDTRTETSALPRNTATGAPVQHQAADVPVGQPERQREPQRFSPTKTSPRRMSESSSVQYTVEAGDTLSKIAATYYASRSRKVVAAIFGANRAVMSNPDQVSIGMKLRLPIVEGFNRPGSATAASSANSYKEAATKSRRATPIHRDVAWYQIKKDDRYVSIAREQLGDSSRWHEIYELNKDLFPDPGKIQWGVRIRLPAVQLALAGSH